MAIEHRDYQFFIISQILRARDEKKSLIVELDAGLGKRIISYLLTEFFKDDRILIITPSQASVRDTFETFKKLYTKSGRDLREVGAIYAGVPSKLRRMILGSRRVVITTPISLANILRKDPSLINDFHIIVVNEVDKVVRRVAYETIEVDENAGQNSDMMRADMLLGKRGTIQKRLKVTYPWNELINQLPKDAIIIGMSGTLRDKHVVRDSEKIFFKPELESLIESLYRGREVEIITMGRIIKYSDLYKYLIRNLTIVKMVGVKDERVKAILDALSDEMKEVATKLAKRYENVLEEKFPSTVEKAISLIPDSDLLKRKFLRLALVRKFVSSSIPEHYVQFLKKKRIKQIIESRTSSKIDELMPPESAKINKIKEIIKKWLKDGKKIAVLCSYVRVAIKIRNELESEGIKTYLLTGKTYNKGRIISDFKNEKTSSVMIMTPVGERDIDLADVDLLIVHDVISTVKTMYQRLKRGRKSFVLILYYEDTYEEEKVKTLLDKMKKKYPWTLKVL